MIFLAYETERYKINLKTCGMFSKSGHFKEAPLNGALQRPMQHGRPQHRTAAPLGGLPEFPHPCAQRQIGTTRTVAASFLPRSFQAKEV